MRRREFITLESRTRSNGARISQSSHETLALKWAPAAAVCGKGGQSLRGPPRPPRSGASRHWANAPARSSQTNALGDKSVCYWRNISLKSV